MNEEMSQSQMGEQLPPEGDNQDYKALYFQEIQNAKKMRGRAQEAEAMIDSFKKQQEEAKVQTLKEQEKYKELSETLKTQLDDALSYKEKYQTWEAQEREELLSMLPEQDRETMKNESLQSLRYITKQLSSKPTMPEASLGMARNIVVDKPYAEMTDAEKRAYYDQLSKR